MLLTGCTTKRYVTVPVPEYHCDTLRTITHHRDSIILRDSVFINRYTRGDTIYSIEQRWHTQYRDRLLRDTAYISSRDTIGVPYPVEKRVPAQLSKFQQMRIWIGNMVIAVLAVCAVWWIISRSNWLRQFLQKHKKQ